MGSGCRGPAAGPGARPLGRQCQSFTGVFGGYCVHAVPNAPSVKKYGKAQSEAPSRPLPSLTCSPRRDRSLPARGPSPGVLTDPEMSVAVPSRCALLYSLSRTCFSPVTPRPGERSCQCTDGPPCISQPRGVCWRTKACRPRCPGPSRTSSRGSGVAGSLGRAATIRHPPACSPRRSCQRARKPATWEGPFRAFPMFTWAGRTLGVARLEQHSPR